LSRDPIRCDEKVLEKELVSSLAIADEIVITPIFKPEAVPEHERLTTKSVVSGILGAGKPAREIADADAIVEAVAPELRSGDVVAILSNGGFGGIYEKLPLRAGRIARRATRMIARIIAFFRTLLALIFGLFLFRQLPLSRFPGR